MNDLGCVADAGQIGVLLPGQLCFRVLDRLGLRCARLLRPKTISGEADCGRSRARCCSSSSTTVNSSSTGSKRARCFCCLVRPHFHRMGSSGSQHASQPGPLRRHDRPRDRARPARRCDRSATLVLPFGQARTASYHSRGRVSLHRPRHSAPPCASVCYVAQQWHMQCTGAPRAALPSNAAVTDGASSSTSGGHGPSSDAAASAAGRRRLNELLAVLQRGEREAAKLRLPSATSDAHRHLSPRRHVPCTASL